MNSQKRLTPLFIVLLLAICTSNSTAQENPIKSTRVASVTKSVVNMKTLAASPAALTTSTTKNKKQPAVQPPSFQTVPAPRSIQEVQTPGETPLTNQLGTRHSKQFSAADAGGPLVPSPGPTQN